MTLAWGAYGAQVCLPLPYWSVDGQPPATARAVPFPAPNANQPPALIPGAGSFLWHGSVSEHSSRRCQPAPRLRHVERRWGALVATGLFRPQGAEAPDGSYTGTRRFRTATPVRCAVRPTA